MNMWVTLNPYFYFITTIFVMVEIYMWKACRYNLKNINKDNNLGVRLYVNVLAEEDMNNSELKLSPDCFWGNFQ